jgi:hypothetical protein
MIVKIDGILYITFKYLSLASPPSKGEKDLTIG